jgi:hypothetical protein
MFYYLAAELGKKDVTFLFITRHNVITLCSKIRQKFMSSLFNSMIIN